MAVTCVQFPEAWNKVSYTEEAKQTKCNQQQHDWKKPIKQQSTENKYHGQKCYQTSPVRSPNWAGLIRNY